MRKIYFVLLAFLIQSTTNLFSQCLNGNAELNNFNGWIGTSSVRNNDGFVFNNMTTGINPYNFSITNPGYDAQVGGNLLSTVGEGNHSFKIGNTDSQEKHADRLSYTFTVTSSNANFGFMFAMVLIDGEHSPIKINPFFSYFIQKGSNVNSFNPNDIIYSKQYIADKSNPFFKIANKNIVWRDWSYECVDLSRYIGQVVTISFIAADCSQGGHWGYAYIDGLCSDPSPVPSFSIPNNICYSDDIIMDATNSQNEDSYFISIQESDQWWNRYGTEYTKWYVAQKAGVINLKDFIQSQGGAFKCNTYYRVKLAVSNNCDNWKDLTKLIYIRCPQMNEISDVFNCCSSPNQYHYAPLGPVTNSTNSIINWQPGPGVIMFGSNNANAGFFYNQNGYVDVTVSDVTSSPHPPYILSICSVTQRIYLLLQDDFTVKIDTNRSDCCSMLLTANIKFKDYCNKWEGLSKEEQNSILNSLDYSWSTGEKTQSITVSGASKEYSVTVGSKCKTHSASYYYNQSPAYSESSEYDVIYTAPNALTPGNSGLSGKLIIMAGTYDSQGLIFPNAGTNKGIYKSEAIMLRVFNRWGEIIWEKTFEDCGKLYQGDVYWDGRDKFGNYVPTGSYVYRIYVKRCNDKDFKPYCNDSHMLRQHCKRKFLFWCLKWEDSYDVGGPCAFWINVIN